MALEWKEEENSVVPKMALYEVDKTHLNPRSQPPVTEKAVLYYSSEFNAKFLL